MHFTPLDSISSGLDIFQSSVITRYWSKERKMHTYNAARHDLWKIFQRKNRVKVLGSARVFAEDRRRGLNRTRFSTRASKTTCEGACAPLECFTPPEPFSQIVMRDSIDNHFKR
jgi:hypothetical protein